VHKADVCCPDQELLARLHADLGSAALGAILAQGLTESGERLDACRQALERGDTATAAREAHTLAGLQRSIGLPALGEAFAALEQQLTRGDRPAGDDLDELASALVQAHAAARDGLPR